MKVGSPYVLPSDLPDGQGGALRFTVVAGAASGTLYTVEEHRPGGPVIRMAAEDTIVSVLQFSGGPGDPTDRTALVSGIETGGFRLSGVSLAGSRLLVGWLDKR